MTHLSTSYDQNTGASASATVLPGNIQGWSSVRLTDSISLLSGDFEESSPAPQFEDISSLAFCLLYGPALTTVCDLWEDHNLDYMGLCWQSNVSAFQHPVQICHHFPSKKQSSSDFMTAVTICSDLGAQEEEIFLLGHCYCQKFDAFELWCWRKLLRVPWTARRSNQSILKEISPGCSLEGLMLKLKL